MKCNNPNGCDCPNPQFCKWFGKPKKAKKEGGLKKTALKKVSTKHRKELDVYFDLRKIFLQKYKQCQVNAEHCTKTATDVHHAARRGVHLNNTGTWIACCRTCHEFVERNPTWSRNRGFLL